MRFETVDWELEGGVAEPWDTPRPPVIVCRDVTKWYGSFKALDNVSLTVASGEVVVFLGPSGAGKSTLLRCLNGLESHSSGHISVLGLTVSGDRFPLDRIRQRVGMVFQEFNLFPHLSVEENVVIAQRVVLGRTTKDSVERADELLEAVGMGGFGPRSPGSLSGGEQQRVAIARMLATEPEIVLMDEPTSSVDPELTRGILDLMKTISESGVTVVVVTHEIGFAREMADRVFFFEHGRLLEEGRTGDVLNRPAHTSTQRFLADIERFWPDPETDDDRSPWAPPRAAGAGPQ